MTNGLFDRLLGHAPWQELLSGLAPGRVAAVYEAPEALRAFLTAALAVHTGRQALYVAPSEQAAQRAASDLEQLLHGRAALLSFPDLQFIRSVAGREGVWKRLSVLERLKRGDADVLCVSADALLRRFLPAPVYDALSFTLRKGEAASLPEVADRLAALGYERVDMVEGRGQWALRGDILDIYPPCEDQAVRVEFFDSVVDTLRVFDWGSQKSLFPVDAVRVTPANEYLVPPSQREAAFERMDAALRAAREGVSPGAPPSGAGSLLPRGMQADAEELKERGYFRGIHLWAHLALPETVMLTGWMKDPLLVLDTPDRCLARAEDRYEGFVRDLQHAVSAGEALAAQQGLLYTPEEVLKELRRHPLLTLQELLRGMGGLAPDRLVSLKGIGTTRYKGRFAELSGELRAWRDRGFAVAVFAGGTARAERLRDALEQHGLSLPVVPEEAPPPRDGAFLLPLSLSGGFILEEAGIVLLSGTELLPSGRSKARRASAAGERIEAFTDLKDGDHVVHEQHGIGIYRGTVRLQSEGAFRDYLYIQYRGNDKLYVPVDQFDRVQKYIGSPGSAPPLSDLGSGDWERQKKKVRSGLQKLAIDLVRLYAARQSAPGFPFAAHPVWEEEFADGFEFELTPDQRQAVGEVLSDMARPVNMDRLLCGDVGYGKTEVAMRAAFRALVNNRQTAFLAPTTILVHQHYRTLKKRFDGFPVTVEFVSRFKSPAENREVLKRTREGKVDILVGTHRLLSRDVAFDRLGLLVVDEEQRFGVGHKESIKNLRRSLDVLTLSATPIPRTLHMSMVGVRDMSLLETPPEERYPVQTHVADYSESLVRDAILRELAREGQVFFLYNRVEHIDRFASQLRALVPEARIAVAHGQMNEQALEDVMEDFYLGRHQVLLCTTIIENGIDIPRANTLLVYDADRFGLSQLYQLRGRVGRSSRMAYAYFLVRPDKLVTPDAEKRLAAIREFTEFGSGFRIAMRDLEIRGSGNLLGPEQSGMVNSIGYDLYCRMIEEAVRQARGEEDAGRERALETRVDLHVNAYLPDGYIPGAAQRMEVYKRIALIKEEGDRLEVLDELIDRFGEPPEPVLNLMDIALLKAYARRIGSDYVAPARGALSLRLNQNFVPDPALLVASMARTDPRLSVAGGKKTSVLLHAPGLNDSQLLREGIRVLAGLLAVMQADAPGPIA